MERGQDPLDKKIEEYIALFGGDLTRFCVYLCDSVSDAEDLFQETWYKAIKNLEKYDDKKPFDKWLMSICINTYKDRQRSSDKRLRFHFGSDEERTQFINSIPDMSDDMHEEYCELHETIMALPEKQKIALTLFYFKDYSIKEISAMLKIPEGTVKSRLSSAKKLIRRRLKNEKQ